MYDMRLYRSRVLQLRQEWETSGVNRRLKAFNMAGEQLRLAGVGSGSDFGTFPARWEVNELLNRGGWMKIFACPEEDLGQKKGKHYEL